MGRRPPLDLSLYLVTDTAMCHHFGLAATVSAAVGAGVSVVQLRDADATDDDWRGKISSRSFRYSMRSSSTSSPMSKYWATVSRISV